MNNSFFTGPMSCNILRASSGKYTFVGTIPVRLAFIFEDAEDARIAAQHGLGLAKQIAKKNGRTIKSRTFDTEQDARDFAHGMGIEVAN